MYLYYAKKISVYTNGNSKNSKNKYLGHFTIFLLLLHAFLPTRIRAIWVCLCLHFVCFSPVSRPRTQIVSLFLLAAILNKFPPSVDKSVTWILLCARVFYRWSAMLKIVEEKALGTRSKVVNVFPKQMKFLVYWGTGGATKSLVPSQQNSHISLCKYSARSRLIPLGETVGGKMPGSRVVPFLRRLTALSCEFQYSLQKTVPGKSLWNRKYRII